MSFRSPLLASLLCLTWVGTGCPSSNSASLSATPPAFSTSPPEKKEPKLLPGVQKKSDVEDPLPLNDLKLQLSRLRELKAQGMEISLIVGRTNEEILTHPPLPELGNHVWVYGDVLPTSLIADSDPLQLTMDFSKSKVLREIDNETFSQIIVDISAWKGLADSLVNFGRQFHRILKPGGKFVFEKESGFETFHSCWADDFRVLGLNLISIHTNFMNKPESADVRRRAYQVVEQNYRQFFLNIGFSEFNYFENTFYPIGNSNWLKDGKVDFYEAVK